MPAIQKKCGTVQTVVNIGGETHTETSNIVESLTESGNRVYRVLIQKFGEVIIFLKHPNHWEEKHRFKSKCPMAHYVAISNCGTHILIIDRDGAPRAFSDYGTDSYPRWLEEGVHGRWDYDAFLAAPESYFLEFRQTNTLTKWEFSRPSYAGSDLVYNKGGWLRGYWSVIAS